MTTSHEDGKPDLHGGRVHIPRSRGALSGILLIIFGAWAAIIPFIGPLFFYAYTPAKAWDWTAARGWLEVLPGAVALLAGVALVVSANRVTASFAAWLGIASGAWLVISRDVAVWLHLGSPGNPASSSPFLAALESLGLFSGIGAAIAIVAALALGRLSVRSVHDVRVAQKHERKIGEQQRKITESAYAEGRRDEAADHHDGVHHDDTIRRSAEPRTSRRAGVLGRLTNHSRRPNSEDRSGAVAAEQQGDR